jgi:hypothetical protein
MPLWLVQYLSMRLAAVNPRVDFGGLDSFLTTEVLMLPSFLSAFYKLDLIYLQIHF